MFNDPVGVLTVAQQKTVAAMLGQSFSQDPFMAYLLPNATTRAQHTTKLFLPMIRWCLRYGGVEVAPEGRGSLIWVSGQYVPFRLSQMVRSGLVLAPFLIGLSAFKRLQVHEAACEHALKAKAPQHFAYLWVVGVHPNSVGRGIGKQMIQSALDTMRCQGYSACLLRTENPNNVALYEHLGFQQIHTDLPVGSGLRYWLLSKELA